MAVFALSFSSRLSAYSGVQVIQTADISRRCKTNTKILQTCRNIQRFERRRKPLSINQSINQSVNNRTINQSINRLDLPSNIMWPPFPPSPPSGPANSVNGKLRKEQTPLPPLPPITLISFQSTKCSAYEENLKNDCKKMHKTTTAKNWPTSASGSVPFTRRIGRATGTSFVDTAVPKQRYRPTRTSKSTGENDRSVRKLLCTNDAGAAAFASPSASGLNRDIMP